MKAMKVVMLVAMLLSGASSHGAEEVKATFQIRTVKRAVKKQVLVEGGWRKDAPCIEATVRTTEDLGSKKAYVKAYFYNRQKEVVAKFDAPVAVSDTFGGATRTLPDYLKPMEYHDVYFPVTSRASEGKDRWARVIVVLGEGNRAVAEIYPADDITSYEFAEKDFASYKGKKTP